MAKFYGEVGYGEKTESKPGVYKDVITEAKYRGEVVRNTRRLEKGEGLNDDVSVNNLISILADQYALEHFFAIRYIKWAGTYWTVTTVEVQRPRLLLTLGSVYNGPKYVPPEED